MGKENAKIVHVRNGQVVDEISKEDYDKMAQEHQKREMKRTRLVGE